MAPMTRWLERAFAGEDAIGLLPNLLNRLRGTSARVAAEGAETPSEHRTAGRS